jgi:hypothetical protein
MFVPVDLRSEECPAGVGNAAPNQLHRTLLSRGKFSGCATGKTIVLCHAATCLLLVPTRLKTSAMEREGLL